MNARLTIHEACRVGDVGAVRRLLSQEPSLVDQDDIHQWRPVFHAALGRHVEIVEILLEAGADLAAHEGYALHYAAEVPDNKLIVRILLEQGILEAHTRPASDLGRQLLAAVFLAQPARVANLLSLHPYLVGEVDGFGDQPLHHAARNGDLEIVRVLLAADANVHAMGRSGHTVLYCAAGHAHAEAVQELLGAGADPSVQFTNAGETVMDWLAEFADQQALQDIRKLILQYQAS